MLTNQRQNVCMANQRFKRASRPLPQIVSAKPEIIILYSEATASAIANRENIQRKFRNKRAKKGEDSDQLVKRVVLGLDISAKFPEGLRKNNISERSCGCHTLHVLDRPEHDKVRTKSHGDDITSDIW